MDKCHYYLSNGLWKIIQKYFDPSNEIQNDFFWGMAVMPNYNSFGSHIISTPWQQSWVTMGILEPHHELEKSEEGSDGLGTSEINVLRREVNFQYTLRNYSSDSFVQQLFSLYSKIQTHLMVNYTESETKTFTQKLKTLLKTLIKECPSTAHTLLLQMLQHSIFVNWCETLLYGAENCDALASLFVYGFCQTETIQFHMPYVVGLLQTPLRYNLCLLLLASDNISFLQSMLEEDKKLLINNTKARLRCLVEKGLEPLSHFSSMIMMEKHFLLQILDLIKTHMDEFPVMCKSQNIPPFIWPLVLLQNWNNSLLSDEILLQLIEKCKESTRDKTILQIAFILEWCVNFCKWRERHDTTENKEHGSENKQNLLEKAKEHSVLYLINNTTDLSEVEWSQIRDLLKRGNSGNEDIKSWDIILFDGYCTLMLVLRTILISAEIDQMAKSQRVKLGDITFLNETFRSLYYEEVTERLKKVKKMLGSLYPLTFRLEILENIFALIFFTFEDVKKLSYFLNGSLDCEKYVEKAQSRSKSVPVEKSSSLKLGRSFSLPGPAVVVPEKIEESALNKKLKQKGFICKKYIVRDLIYLVKECLERLEEDPGQTEMLDVPCSIKPIQMENRLDRLSESVSEATWRLQLVTDPEFISQIGSMEFACGQDPYHHFDGEWSYISHDRSRTGTFKSRKKSVEKQTDSSSQSHSSPGNANSNSNSESQTIKFKAIGPAIMNQMLACDHSLVIQCLSQGDVLNADHIIQMMSSAENRCNLEGELNFTRAINDLRKKVQNISLESPLRKSGMDTVSKSRSLQSIQMIANQGVTSTALTNHMERFLSAYTLPTIQAHTKVSAGSVLQCIENTPAMVTIDLALTTAMTFQDFKDLLNIASKHCPELSTRVQSPISAQTTTTKPLGYIVFSQNMIALLQEINRSQIGETDLEVSLQQFLRAHQYPFSLKSLKDNINFWKHLKLAFSDFEKNVAEAKTLVGCKEGILSKCQKNIKDMQKIFESVTKLAESCTEFMELGKFETPSGETTKNVNYCDLLSRYLSDLSIFVQENVSSKAEDISEPITFHSLLEQSAVDIVDKLIFDFHIEPGVLEKKAQQLGFNLSASLVAGCCPKLPQIVSSVESSKCPSSDRIVLNELVPDYKSPSPVDPNTVVESILSELIIAFQTYSRNKQNDGSENGKNIFLENDISELRNDMKIQKILEKTLEFNFVQLKESETVVFFTNLLNLMMCHCYLNTKLDRNDGAYLKYSFYRDVSFTFIGYNIGKLGFLSIFDLRKKLLGEDLFLGFTSRFPDDFFQMIPDPRLLFAITSFRSSSPPLRLFCLDTFESDIEKSIDEYVQNSVSVQKDTVFITDLLELYLDKVLVSDNLKKTGSSKENTSDRVKVLVKFLINHSSGELKEELKSLQISGLSINLHRTHEEIMLKLDHDVNYPPGPTEEKFEEKWMNRRLSDSILRHFNQSSRVLADIVQKIHEAKEPPQTEVARDVLTEEKLKYLDLLFSAPWLQYVAPLFNGNTVLTALSKHPEERQLVEFCERCAIKKQWNECLLVLFALPDHYIFSDLNVRRFKDIALREMTVVASEGDQENPWYYSEHISDVNIRMETVTSCCKHWPGSVSVLQLSSILHDNPQLPPEQCQEIKSLIKKIKVYNTIAEVSFDLDARTWFDVCTIADSSPSVIIKSLVKNDQLELCLQWISLPGILNSIQQFVDSDFMLVFFDHLSHEYELVDQLVNSLPPSKLSEIYDQVIFKLTSVSSISHVVQRALLVDPSPRYRLVEVSLKFLLLVDSEEQSRLIHLISHPLLIVEQLLMNMKLEALEKVLKKARQIEDEELVSQDEINKLIVFYVSKAVEFDFVKALKSTEVKQTFLLGTASPTSPEQVIPSEVPNKSQWVPDNTVSLCMCCRLVSFSMFNRRHHCRRCGRVICGSCSTYRMKVTGYRGVAVRVCQHCYLHHTKTDAYMKGSQSTDTFESSSFTQDLHCWKLSTDPSRNATIRDEFSFEFSPNVPLCLAIFNLLPDASYSSVLLDESEKMLKILQLNGKSGNPEVDCGVVIQIIRSLVIGAKVKYGQAGLISGLDSCDQLLSQVDLLQLLINNHCSRLIPSEPLISTGSTLRCLRDKLVEEELWELAIEVSTKCRLDRSGVWAAWGKVCLAAGSWQEARVKFAHCLTSTPKPLRNPPLVDEICQILESATSYVNVKAAQKLPEKDAVAQEVSQVLSTLKLLSQGKSLPSSVISAKNSVQYEEQIFYLTTYGSHQGLLSFYLRQGELKTAFTYLLQQQLEPEVFLESLLLPSYKSDQHERFKSDLLAVDPSLESFMKYLSYSCMYLQKSGYLHTLYDIQILMQDYIRAAVTCIHLYQRNAVSFTDLMSRSSHLHTALKHLEKELAATNKKTKRSDHVMKMEPKEINRHMNTIWRQVETAKFLAACETKDKFIVKDIFPDEITKENEIPTLFDGISQRSVLVKLIILLGKNVSEGFGIAFRIIQEHQLDSESIYVGVGKKLAEAVRVNDIKALVECLKTSGADNVTITMDKMLSASVPILFQNGVPTSDLEPLVKTIRNVDLKISTLIATLQLIPAYILAVRHNRISDIERIVAVADQQGQTIIKKVFMAKLSQSAETRSSDDGSVLPSSGSSQG